MLAATAAPPIAHALGGAIGTALSLSMLYPLERARIEMQNAAFQASLKDYADDEDDKSDPVQNELLNSNTVLPEVAQEERNAILLKGGGAPTATLSPPKASWGAQFHDIQDSEKTNLESSQPIAVGFVQQKPPARTSPLFSSAVAVQEAEPVKGLRQTMGDLFRNNELYQGMAPVVATLAASQFIFFYLHALIKKLLVPPGATPTAMISFATATLAGVINALITNPMWLINLNIVTGKTETSNLFREMYIMAKTRGVPSLFKGTLASLFLVANPVLQMFCYHQMRQSILGTRAVLLPLEAFAIGALAKAISTVSTYPMQLAQTIQRLDTNNSKTMGQTLSRIHQRKGTKGLYQGMQAKLLQTVLTSAFTFLSYETLLGVIHKVLMATAGAQ